MRSLITHVLRFIGRSSPIELLCYHMPISTHIITIWTLQHRLNDSITAKWSFSFANKETKDSTKRAASSFLPFIIFVPFSSIVFTRHFPKWHLRRWGKEENVFRSHSDADERGIEGGWRAKMRKRERAERATIFNNKMIKSGPCRTLLRCE